MSIWRFDIDHLVYLPTLPLAFAPKPRQGALRDFEAPLAKYRVRKHGKYLPRYTNRYLNDFTVALTYIPVSLLVLPLQAAIEASDTFP